MLNIDNNLYMLVLEQMGCISIVDKECRYVYVNEAWVNNFKISRKKVLGKFAKDIMPNTKIDVALRTGKVKFSSNNNCNLGKYEINIHLPLVADDKIAGGLTYTEFCKYDCEGCKKLEFYNSLKLKDRQNILEEEALNDALKLSNGNKTIAAKILGISRTVIYDKIKKYDLI